MGDLSKELRTRPALGAPHTEASYGKLSEQHCSALRSTGFWLFVTSVSCLCVAGVLGFLVMNSDFAAIGGAKFFSLLGKLLGSAFHGVTAWWLLRTSQAMTKAAKDSANAPLLRILEKQGRLWRMLSVLFIIGITFLMILSVTAESPAENFD